MWRRARKCPPTSRRRCPKGALESKSEDSVIDPDNNESYAGEKAAAESLRMRPDNPNRPMDLPGEDAFKVQKGGALGREPVKPGEPGAKTTPGGAKGLTPNAPTATRP